MPTISITISGDEQPASVSLRTLTREDTGDTVPGVTLPSNFTSAGSGLWQFTFTAPAANLHYDYSFRLNWSDGSFNDEVGALDDGAGGTSYASYSAIVAKYGTTNIGIVSNTENETTTADTGRIDAALSFADRFVDEFLGGVGYVTPIASPPSTLSDICVDLAYTFLMQPRVYRDDQNGDGRELFFAKRDAKARLQHLAAFGMGTAPRIGTDDPRPTY